MLYNKINVKASKNKKRFLKLYFSFIFEGGYYVCLRIFDKILGGNSADRYLYEKSKGMNQMFYKEELSKIYAIKMGMKLNLDNPNTFNEKIQWLKIHDATPLKTKLADKYLVREWIKEKIGEKYLIPMLGVWETFEEIDLSKLPNAFVLKANHGSTWNIVVRDKTTINWEVIQKKFHYWMGLNYAFVSGFEMQYFSISPKIIAEEYIESENGNLYDYKIHCFNGIPKFIHIIGNREFETHCAKEAFYDINWKLQPFTSGVYSQYNEDRKKPRKLDEMLWIAEKLSVDFIYVRVDLYELANGEIKFGEMTFTPGSGFYQWKPPEIDEILGEKIELPIIM